MGPTVRTFAGITAAGALAAVALPEPYARSYALEVKGVGGTPTSWNVLLEGSLDGQGWTQLAQHNAGDGTTVYAADKPVTRMRVNVAALTLGPASAINVNVLATP